MNDVTQKLVVERRGQSGRRVAKDRNRPTARIRRIRTEGKKVGRMQVSGRLSNKYMYQCLNMLLSIPGSSFILAVTTPPGCGASSTCAEPPAPASSTHRLQPSSPTETPSSSPPPTPPPFSPSPSFSPTSPPFSPFSHDPPLGSTWRHGKFLELKAFPILCCLVTTLTHACTFVFHIC